MSTETNTDFDGDNQNEEVNNLNTENVTEVDLMFENEEPIKESYEPIADVTENLDKVEVLNDIEGENNIIEQYDNVVVLEKDSDELNSMTNMNYAINIQQNDKMYYENKESIEHSDINFGETNNNNFEDTDTDIIANNNIEDNNVEDNNIEDNYIEDNNVEDNNIEDNYIEDNNVEDNNIEDNYIEDNNVEELIRNNEKQSVNDSDINLDEDKILDDISLQKSNTNANMLINVHSKQSTTLKEEILDKEIPQFESFPQMSQIRNPVSALTPIYSLGFNRFVPIINLSTDKRCFIFYSCSHLGVLYDYYNNEQLLLQGHCNSITCTTASNDKRWLGTGDQGENSVVIIWDCNTGLPVRTMFEPHPNGVVAISLTSDARYLATLSAENTQTFAVWDWTTGEDIPLCSASLSSNYGLQNFISFNNDDFFHVATNSETQVLFFQWNKIGNIKYFAPKLTDQDFNKPIGKFCNTVFLPKSTKALSATSQGLLVVWEGNLSLLKVPNESSPDKKAIKLVPIHDKAITVLTLTNSYIVTGDVGGDVKFFDYNYMLIFWYQDWNFGPITSISSSTSTNLDRMKMLLEKSDYPEDATIQNNKFAIHDFIIGTATTIFATVTVKGSKIKIIFREHDQSVFSVHAHPSLPLMATGSYSGLLKIWDYEKKQSVKTRLFNKIPIKCVCFDHLGAQLAIGFANGEVRILDTYVLKDITSKPFHFSKVHITHIQFSEKSEFLATVDGNHTTTLYRQKSNKYEEQWVYISRYRAHYKRVLDLLFGRYYDSSTPRLFTLGEDRRLVEYDLYNISDGNLKILQETRIEQSAIPLTMCWYPEENSEGFIVTANDEYKLKMYNHQTKMCRRTFLGPTFGSPVKILKVLPETPKETANSNSKSKSRFIAYANYNKIGLIRVPLNGNPYNYMTMIAHPKSVTSLCCSFDGKYLISVGQDYIVTTWNINLDILEQQAEMGGNGMSPYYELIEGGEFGQFIRDLKDYFYYSMIRTQGIDSLQRRNADVVIDISEVSYIMRAIGFYPSEEEIENMLNELKFTNYFRTGQCMTKVDLNTFLKLYINHRPAFGIASEKIENAFRIIMKSEDGELTINKFLNLLMNKGENIVEDDLAEYLATLLGFNEEGGSLEMKEFRPEEVMKAVNEALPKIVTAKTFIEDIICMKILDQHPLHTPTKVQEMFTSSTQT